MERRQAEEKELFEQKVEATLQEIDALSKPYINLIESLPPDNPNRMFGERTTRHMRRMVKLAEEIGKEERLSAEEIGLLKIICRAHDLGRHIETLRGQDRMRPGVRHGQESAEFLEKFNILKDFTPGQQNIIKGAVFYHSEKEVPKPEGNASDEEKLTYRLCYLLRDIDKEEILLNNAHVNDATGEVIYNQIYNYYLNQAEKEYLLNQLSFREDCISRIKELIVNPNHATEEEEENGEIIGKIGRIINRGISPAALESFRNQQTINLREIKYSYATYMLLQIAVIFDMKSPFMIKKISNDKEKYLGSRLRFIQARVKPEQFDEIQNVLSSFFSNTPN